MQIIVHIKPVFKTLMLAAMLSIGLPYILYAYHSKPVLLTSTVKANFLKYNKVVYTFKTDSDGKATMPTSLNIKFKKYDKAKFSSRGIGMYRPPSWLSLSAGTQGIGLDYKFGYSEFFTVSAGVNLLPVGLNAPLSFQGLSGDMDVKASFFNAHLMGHIYPFTGRTRFKIVPGVAYFVKAKGSVLANPANDNYRYGSINLTSDEVGTLNSSASWKGIAPFLGAGLDDINSENRLRLSFLVGSYLMPKAHNVSVFGTNLLQGNETNLPAIQNNLKTYRWLPVLQIELNYMW